MVYGTYTGPDKPDKGLEGGSCNRRLCQASPALWFNHGSEAWYCIDCRNDIEFDRFNLLDWRARHQPLCGHPMFETRDMMLLRKLDALDTEPEDILDRLPSYPDWVTRPEYHLPTSSVRTERDKIMNSSLTGGVKLGFYDYTPPRPFLPPLRDGASHYASERPLSKRAKRRMRGRR